MPRRIPEHRLKDLIDTATRVFIAQGYRRTQMADVAKAMGVAKGTLYLYVESKHALFDAVLRHADTQLPAPGEVDLPLPTPEPGSLLRALLERLSEEVVPPALRRALGRRRAIDPRAELEEILRELYATASRNRTAIKLIERCGHDHPELASVFFIEARMAQLETIERYLASRASEGQLVQRPDTNLAARFIIETITTWAIHIHWDPAPQLIDPRDAEDMTVHFLLAGLIED